MCRASAVSRSGTRRRLALLALGVLAAGCGVTSVGATTSSSNPVGAGSTATHSDPVAAGTADAHTVQPQPAPGSCHARRSGLFSLPDPHCTPGAADPSVTQANIDETICRTGYTRTVRPPESITEREKRASLAAYGDTRPLHYYEYDHLIALELGGAPNDPHNLWPESGASPNPKDTLEGRLRREVCAGEITLGVAQRAIARNWVLAYHRYVR
jgi:hypothetical protein